jgi:tetratricopeptide (TPR) repeat protein
MGEVLLKIGDVAGALEVLEESERIARAAGEPGVLAMCLTTLGTARVAAGEHERAERELSGALDIARAEGDPFLLTKIHYYLAGLALLRGDADQARALCDSATRSARDSGDRSWVHHVDEMRARTLPLQAREEAMGLARASLQAFHEAGSRSCFPHSFEVRARLLASAAEGDSVPLAAAARLVGAADGVCARLSIAMLPVERALLNQTRGTVRDRLGVSAFDAAYADGFAWTEQMAVERASD